jgi:hypothetical protein
MIGAVRGFAKIAPIQDRPLFGSVEYLGWGLGIYLFSVIMKLTVIQDTFFKQYTQDSSRLKPSDRVEVLAGQSFEIHSWKTAGRSHYKVALIDETLGDPARNTWYVYAPHVRLLNSQDKPPTFDPKPSTSFPGNLPRTKLLNVPHKGQLDNALNPKGACNVTCFAMAMTYFQLPGKTNAVQLEDELYRYMTANRLSRHEPEDLAKMAKAYGPWASPASFMATSPASATSFWSRATTRRASSSTTPLANGPVRAIARATLAMGSTIPTI